MNTKETGAPDSVGRVADGDVSNSSLIVFPSDDTGFSYALRQVGIETTARLNGSEEKLRIYIATLRVLAQHANARFIAMRNAYAADVTDAIAKEAAREAAEAAAQAAEIIRLEALVLHTGALLAAARTAADDVLRADA